MTRTPVARVVLTVAAGALIGSIALVGYMAYQITVQGQKDERRAVDAIVVLGAAQFNGTPSDVFRARLEHAVELWKEGLASYFVVTGGKLPDDRTTEAATARSYAIRHGVPESAILSEDGGRTTLESLEAVAAIFRERGLSSGLFVSDETHMLRVLRMGSDLGIEAWGVADPHEPDGSRPGAPPGGDAPRARGARGVLRRRRPPRR